MKSRIDHRSMRFRLILTIGLILLVFQVISVVWLWHESKEQIQFLVEAQLQKRNMDRHVEREVHEAVASLAVPSLVMITLTLLLCYQAVKWITRPLYQLQRELENRSEENLDPIACHSSVHEIDAVTQAINQLVARLNNSLERERLFTADVAHELRTPLAGLRLHLELIERNGEAHVQPLLQRLDQMTHSVSQLLQLARAGQSFTSGTYQNVALIEDVILPMEAELSTMLDAHQQTLTLDLPEELFVRGDATLLKMLLRNLVENAHRYSPKESAITLRLASGAQPTLTVEDEGPGIDESKSGELSKAFIRMDSRYGGIGLGLSIVSRIVQLHRFQFFLENRRDRSGCRAVIKF
ncbi:two-component system sensor histidine kinase PmrB [Pantoea sp. S-LA4]|jgi:two-component system sensor histidine kinase BasS|uniref:two-component system sensor histidine kinase PmrB n=1 Tax=Pantoea TaxID=53335 RepID=UPI001F2A462D|nr:MULTISPECIES: two-component system sensor histidine kinase PmrB [Pantoea]UIL53938.1 two-component system sensor histidine kinase PmrB [Pantoea agglomerans]